jgi:hypothetical protein
MAADPYARAGGVFAELGIGRCDMAAPINSITYVANILARELSLSC